MNVALKFTKMSLLESRKKMLRYSLAQIEECIENGRFGRALAHFCVVFKIQPSAKSDMKELFLLAVGEGIICGTNDPVSLSQML